MARHHKLQIESELVWNKTIENTATYDVLNRLTTVHHILCSCSIVDVYRLSPLLAEVSERVKHLLLLLWRHILKGIIFADQEQ